MPGRRIIFTGGGTAGHVTPNLALIERLAADGWDIAYVGSKQGIERQIVAELDIPYFAISTGKLRRYFDWRNFVDPVRILWGFLQSLSVCLRYRPDVVFSKGGFVAVPLVVAAWLCRVTVIAHESDMTPGLANRLCYPFAAKICVNFPQTAKYLPAAKVLVTGSPVRQALLNGDAAAGRRALGLTDDKPVLLVFGGSLGAATINNAVRAILGPLTNRFQVVHIVGAGNLDPALDAKPGYVQREYVGREFGDLLAAASLVVSRAGANSLYELLVTRKPHILIPLPLSASRGDQIVNAREFERAGMSLVIAEEQLTGTALLATIDDVMPRLDEIRVKLGEFEIKDSVDIIVRLLTADRGQLTADS